MDRKSDQSGCNSCNSGGFFMRSSFMNYTIPLSHRLENSMRTLKKPVTEYFAYLQSPLNPRNKAIGKRIVDMESIRDCHAYAGSRTRTPGIISVNEPWRFREQNQSRTCAQSRTVNKQMVFSAFYRPHIRVNIKPTRSKNVSDHLKTIRLRKAVPDCRCLSTSLNGPPQARLWHW